MLRFSLRRSKEPQKLKEAEEDLQADGEATNKDTVRVNYTSRTWLANLRKRTLSVESLSNLFSSVGRTDHGRRESANSMTGSITGGSNSRLMRTHKMQTKSGDPVEVYFGYDALSINGRSISYADVVFWSHSASHFTMTYLSKSTGRRKDVVLYATEKGPRPSDLTDMLSVRIAKLVADQTGCSEEKAMRMATAKANEAELKEAVQALEQNQDKETSLMRKPSELDQWQQQRPEVRSSTSGILTSFDGAKNPNRAGSGMVEVTGEETKQQTTAESLEEDGVGKTIPEGDEALATPIGNSSKLES